MNSYYLLAIGLGLGVFELVSFSFFVIFFALGFFIVGIINIFYPLDLEEQIALVAIISIISMLVFRKSLLKNFHKDNFNDDFLDESGEGIVKNNMIYYKGAFWKSNKISHLKEGDTVKISGIKNNQIILENTEQNT